MKYELLRLLFKDNDNITNDWKSLMYLMMTKRATKIMKKVRKMGRRIPEISHQFMTKELFEAILPSQFKQALLNVIDTINNEEMDKRQHSMILAQILQSLKFIIN